MSTAAQIAANRANAQCSTGPRDTGRTKFNGTQHGLTSKQTVLPGEDPAEYTAFASAMTTDLGPQSELERVLADRIVAAAWRLRRFTRIESAFFTNRVEAFLEGHAGADPDAALANLFADPAEASRMRLFLRYQSAVQREFDTAYKQFEKARQDRIRQAVESEILSQVAESAKTCPTGSHHPDPLIGFGSYNASGIDTSVFSPPGVV